MRNMAMGKSHPAELRARAVAELVTGRSPAEVSREYGIPVRTLQTWLRESTSSWVVQHRRGIDEERGFDLGGLVSRMVAEMIETLVVQSQFLRNDDWLAKQDAA